jgi:hypothetical protein
MRANQSHRTVNVVLGVLACAVLASTSAARVVEGFESGDPAVSATGDAGPQTTFEGEAAPQPTHQYLLTSLAGADADGQSNVSGNNAVSNATLQSFFFNDFSLTGLRGSGVLIPFTVVAGDTTLTLQYDFLSNQPLQTTPKNDFAFEGIFDSTNGAVQSNLSFVSVNNPHVAFTAFGAGPFFDHTGYQTLTLNISGLVPGNYNLGIGVEALAGGTNQHDSGILIDNIQVLVPEPSTVAFAIAGAALLVVLRSRIKRTS